MLHPVVNQVVWVEPDVSLLALRENVPRTSATKAVDLDGGAVVQKNDVVLDVVELLLFCSQKSEKAQVEKVLCLLECPSG